MELKYYIGWCYKMADTLFYRCSVCGNIVAKVKNGGGTLSCCGQPMVLLTSNSTDAATEKHVPIVTNDGGKIKVTVGSIMHPMLAEHFIEWVALITDSTIQITYLKPGMEPTAEFDYSPKDELTKKAIVYAYCNLHGLWKTEI